MNGGQIKDLSANRDLLFQMLDDTWVWKVRLSHELVIRDADHVSSIATYVIRIPLDLVQAHEPKVKAGELIRVIIPLVSRPKGLLLDAKFSCSTGVCPQLLLRNDIAEIEAAYVAHLARHTLAIDPPEMDTITGICSYVSGMWDHSVATERRWLERRGEPEGRHLLRALKRYLDEGVLGFRVTEDELEDLLSRTSGAESVFK